MKVIVTGAVGLIGRNVVAELNRRGVRDILLVDRLGVDDRWKYLLGLEFEDFMGIDEFRERLRSGRLPVVDGVVHEGACSATTERDADFLLDNNYGFTRELCEWSLGHDARFVYASSAATYGDGALGYSDDDAMTPRYRPLNMYGYSKHMFDLWALRRGLFDRIVGLKYYNVYGPYEDHKGDMRSVVNKAFYQIREEGRVQLFRSHRADYRDGEQVRDFVYVDDAVKVSLHFLEDRAVSGLFNCGTGRTRTWLDLVRAVFAALDVEPNIEFVDMPEGLRDRYQYHTQADSSKLAAAGYGGAFMSLEDGVRDYVQGYLLKQVEGV